MRAATDRRMLHLLVALALTLMGPLVVPARAQDEPIYSIAVDAFACPEGMTAETLVPEDCDAITGGFAVYIAMTETRDPEVTLDDAFLDGTTFVWDDTLIRDLGLIGEATIVASMPDGYVDQIITGDVSLQSAGPNGELLSVLTVGPDSPNPAIQIFYFTSRVPAPDLEFIVAIPFACPTEQADFGECETLAGVTVSVEVDGVELEGSPFVSTVNGIGFNSVDFHAPGDSVITLTEIDGVPNGYVPLPDNDPLTIPVSELEVGGCGGESFCLYAYLVNVPDSEPEPEVEPTTGEVTEPEEEPTAVPVIGRPAHIHAGTCDNLAKAPIVKLIDTTAPDGDWAGDLAAIAAESSYSVVPISLDELLASPHAIHLHLGRGAEGGFLACGDIGGVRDARGGIAIGLSEDRGSSFEGIAYLAPDADDPALTDVQVYVAPKLAEEEQPTAQPIAGTPAGE